RGGMAWPGHDGGRGSTFRRGPGGRRRRAPRRRGPRPAPVARAGGRGDSGPPGRGSRGRAEAEGREPQGAPPRAVHAPEAPPPAPEAIHTESREGHAVELRLETPDGPLASGTFHASSRLVAEQMAARRLLELWGGGEAPAAWPVTEAQEEQLKQQNPKGRLLEL